MQQYNKAFVGAAGTGALVMFVAKLFGVDLTIEEAGAIGALAAGLVGAVVWWVPNITNPEALLLAAAKQMDVELTQEAAAQLAGKFRRLLLELRREQA